MNIKSTKAPNIFGASFYEIEINQQEQNPEQDEFFSRMGRIIVKETSSRNFYQKKLASLQQFVKNAESD